MKKIILAIFAMLLIANVMAVPAYPKLVQIKQADGSILNAYIKGDEKVNWVESEEGFTLLPNKEGIYEYAILNDNSSLVCSGVRYTPIDQRLIKEKNFCEKLQPKLKFSQFQVDILQQAWEVPSQEIIESTIFANSPVIRKMPIILAGYSDVGYVYEKADFEDLINKPNYNLYDASGSVFDYFSDNSNGLLDFYAAIYGPYTLSKNRAYYGGNVGGSDAKPRDMVKEALALAYEDSCDFSLYDADNDGWLDGLHLIFAGKGEEAGGGTSAIWSHAWALASPVSYNGVKIQRYSCSPELASDSKLTKIGVIVHEMSHALGLPDLYDSDYTSSGGQAVDLGEFDVMAQGSWNNDGITPPSHNSWSKAFLGWQRLVELKDSVDVELLPSENSSVAYYYTTKTNNEFYYLDNRGTSKWDEYLPGKGMTIYHINRSHSGWNNNCINCNPNNRGFYIKQAGGNLNSTSRLNSASPYPGSDNIQSFTDETIPNSKSKAGEATEKPITNITYDEASGLISFQFMGGGKLLTDGFELDTKKIELQANKGSSKIIRVLSPIYTWQVIGSDPYFEVISNWDSSYIEINALEENNTGEIRKATFWVCAYGRDTNEIEITQNFKVGTENTKQRTLSIYPNPVSNNQFNILCKDAIKEVKLYSVDGKFVKNINGNLNTNLQVDIKNFKNGLYFVIVTTSEGMFTQKIIKK